MPSILERCTQFAKLAAEKRTLSPLPIANPYESGERPAIHHKHHPEHEKPQKEFEEAHKKSRKMVISKEQALDEVIDNGADPEKFLAEMGDSEFYIARDFLSWILKQ